MAEARVLLAPGAVAHRSLRYNKCRFKDFQSNLTNHRIQIADRSHLTQDSAVLILVKSQLIGQRRCKKSLCYINIHGTAATLTVSYSLHAKSPIVVVRANKFPE